MLRQQNLNFWILLHCENSILHNIKIVIMQSYDNIFFEDNKLRKAFSNLKAFNNSTTLQISGQPFAILQYFFVLFFLVFFLFKIMKKKVFFF